MCYVYLYFNGNQDFHNQNIALQILAEALITMVSLGPVN